ncbi:MAG: hypothetical protein NVSMB51_11420 [Solirubrobacteraceae bacterium]
MPGPAVIGLRLGCQPQAWRALGFVVDQAGACRVGATVLQLGDEGDGIRGWTLLGPSGSASLDGLPTQWSEAPSPSPRHPERHPIGALAIDHVVVTTPDFKRTLAALDGAGMKLRRTRQAPNGARQGFFRDGEAVVEVVGPEIPQGDGPARFWGLVAAVQDIDVAAPDGPDRIKDAVQPGRRITTVATRPGLSVRLALISP